MRNDHFELKIRRTYSETHVLSLPRRPGKSSMAEYLFSIVRPFQGRFSFSEAESLALPDFWFHILIFKFTRKEVISWETNLEWAFSYVNVART